MLGAKVLPVKPKPGGGTPLRHRRNADATLFPGCRKNQMEHIKIAEVHKAMWSPAVRNCGHRRWRCRPHHAGDHAGQQTNCDLLVDTGTVAGRGASRCCMPILSPDVASAVSAYKKARNRQDYSKKTLDRSKDLLDHKVIAVKDLEAAGSSLQQRETPKWRMTSGSSEDFQCHATGDRPGRAIKARRPQSAARRAGLPSPRGRCRNW